MTTESEIEHKLVEMVKRHRGYCLKFVSPGSAGVPDRILLLPGGRAVFVETKRPYGGRISKLQYYWKKKIERLGFEHWFVWSAEDIAALEQSIK